MNEKMLLEHIDRIGVVTPGELARQTGWGQALWRQHVVNLIEKREVFLCRLDHGRETLLSRHMLFCLRSVYSDPELSAEGQELYDWISDNELCAEKTIRREAGLDGEALGDAFEELQQKLCLTPMVGRRNSAMGSEAGTELSAVYEFLWVTADYWLQGIHKAARYKDLAYCVSELKRLMKTHFSSKELNNLIYHGAI